MFIEKLPKRKLNKIVKKSLICRVPSLLTTNDKIYKVEIKDDFSFDVYKKGFINAQASGEITDFEIKVNKTSFLGDYDKKSMKESVNTAYWSEMEKYCGLNYTSQRETYTNFVKDI